ncbi:MAG TPA: hypothetical protein DDZ51_28625 [Planctomycetaceae bacterium]|nr:hypothetical protein [Planctomycetaceae bacterium]
MTPRERILGIGVGSILVLAGCQYVLMQYRTAVASRQARVETLDQQILEAQERLLQGAYADRMMGEYLVRSLPSDIEKARADYTRWLYEIITMVELRDASVSFTNTLPAGDLYKRHQFKLSGKTDQRGWLELMHLFYTKDYLHRISNLVVRPFREGGLFVDMTIDVIGLDAAQPDLAAPTATSPMVDSFAAYADPILNRNFFSPPNQAPKFTTPSRLTATLGQSPGLVVKAEDPEKDNVRYAVIGTAPEGLELDSRTGEIKWNPTTPGNYPLAVEAIDSGYPAQRIEQRFEIAVVNPPPPPPPAKEPEPTPGFDDATQTVLTALVQGGGDWTAWMKVRTQGTTVKLRPGDKFEIGRLSGTVVDVNARFVTLESEGRRFKLRPAGNLAEAAKSAQGAAKTDENAAPVETAAPVAAVGTESLPADDAATTLATPTSESPLPGDSVPAALQTPTQEPPAAPASVDRALRP